MKGKGSSKGKIRRSKAVMGVVARVGIDGSVMLYDEPIVERRSGLAPKHSAGLWRGAWRTRREALTELIEWEHGKAVCALRTLERALRRQGALEAELERLGREAAQ